MATVVGKARTRSAPSLGVANDIGALILHVEDGVTVTPGRGLRRAPGVA